MNSKQTQSLLSAEQNDALSRGRAYCADHHPHLEAMLSDWFDDMLPDFSESLIEWAYGRHYSRPGLDTRTRQLATLAALTVLGGQTAPQLKINIEHSLAVGASKREIVEVIWQMAVYGGLPAAINGLSVAKEVFAEHTP
ncbi:carboxymuconolactone decarboxylase family protein [uncultured Cohaesibacter sp.]|uniref:carboxymuconolactone decarboxylase family protein n=1 Tax=uncultured Cohaesibacter sp. TaxID=1002546 RepID=UPI00292EB0E5|nr:carboxymuconolactone decarboxylase family protein [uncultured Cohaesibacter sp.]